jgi:hypothetical protein
MELFRRFAVAMDFVAVAVLERELHRMIGLSCWRLANQTEADAARIGIDSAQRAEYLRRQALQRFESALCVRRSRLLLRESRQLLEWSATAP